MIENPGAVSSSSWLLGRLHIKDQSHCEAERDGETEGETKGRESFSSVQVCGESGKELSAGLGSEG